MKASLRRLSMDLAMVLALVSGGCGGGDSQALRASLDTAQTGARETAAVSGSKTAQNFQPSAALAAPGNMKWNPGHYVVFQADEGDHAVDSGLKEVEHLPFVKGIVVRAYWQQIEKDKDVYSFWRIERFLNKAAARQKRFFLLLSLRSFRSDRVAPAYLHTPYYDGGVFHIQTHKDSQGEVITLWNEHTRHRVTKLIRTLAARYNSHPYFEGLILTETAFGRPVEPVTAEQKTAYYVNFIRLDTAARAAFANTVVIQFVNFPKEFTPAIVSNLQAQGLGYGSPDVFMADDDHEKYVYPFNDQVRGQIPIGMQVESDSYYSPYGGGPFDPPDVWDLYEFSRDRLYSNYVFWERDLRPPLVAWKKVLKMFNSPEFPATPTGGLEAACPSRYTRCVGQDEAARASGTAR
ncbi:hypothetical protein [Azohydromonas caseinilytica]|uniref:Glycoside hydrolase family 42 N-terminal domain-containing protein n=1 Tax=Azohydromonas caseinilytica TaxID=2728836 RepID=A0A848FCQ9_9BURK|nr:hypothetical protein [Azohydromonas caseinilytica]NML17092.1 hypothetical protein [Azohydromonas caseinilytica]